MEKIHPQWNAVARLKEGSQQWGIIRVSKAANHQGLNGYRAVFSHKGPNSAGAPRKYGSVRPTVYEASMQIITALADVLAPGEEQRLSSEVKVMHMGPNLGCGKRAYAGSQPPPKKAKRDDTEPAPLKAAESVADNVAYVHQLYGFYKDGKEKPDVFVESNRRWKQVAMNMGAIYHEWTPEEAETLIRNHYPQYWQTYVKVRYPIQRVDMARIAILHFYGGLYSDMDVIPNRYEYPRQQFAVCAVPAGLAANDKAFFDMEVISANPKNPVLLKWLDYTQKQIQEKDYRAEKSVWKNRRMRYVYQTTGPAALKRFLDELNDYKALGRITCNRFDDYPDLSPKQKEVYDVLTRRSNSYFTNEFEIHVPVSTKDVPLPIQYTKLRRMTSKTWLRGTLKPRARSHVPESGEAGDGAAGGDAAAEHLPGAQPPSPPPIAAFEDAAFEAQAAEKQLLKTILRHFYEYGRRTSPVILAQNLKFTFQMDKQTRELVFQALPEFDLYYI